MQQINILIIKKYNAEKLSWVLCIHLISLMYVHIF